MGKVFKAVRARVWGLPTVSPLPLAKSFCFDIGGKQVKFEVGGGRGEGGFGRQPTKSIPW